MFEPAVYVTGVKETVSALRKLDAKLAREVTGALREAAEPIRAKAQTYAESNISNIGTRWPRMRVGVGAGSVYVVPASRRGAGGSPRPNLADLLLDEAMYPALEEGTPMVLSRIEAALDVVVRGF